MEHTGIIRRIDDLGRVAIPKEVRRILGYADDQPLEFFPDPENGCLTLKRYSGVATVSRAAAYFARSIRQDNCVSAECGKALLEKLAEIEAIIQAEKTGGQ